MKQKMASVIVYVNETLNKLRAGGVRAYYQEMPQNFNLPCVYFSSLEAFSSGGTLNSFKLENVFKIDFFDVVAEDAFSLALDVLTDLLKNRSFIELVDKEGRKTGKSFRVSDSKIKRQKNGVSQLVISWLSFVNYDSEEYEKSSSNFTKLYYKSDNGDI